MDQSNGTFTPQSNGGTKVPFDFTLTTDRFHCPPPVYLRTRIRCNLSPYLAIPALMLAVSAIIGMTIGVKWFIAGLLIILFILPMMVAHAYFSMLLTMDAYLALSPKRVSLDSDRNLTIVYEKRDPENQEERSPHPSQQFTSDAIIATRLLGKYVWMEVSGLSYPLLIPIEAFPESYDYHRLCLPDNDTWNH